MDLSLKVFVVALLLLVATEEQGGGSVQVALARECRSQSHKFHGACIRDTNCASVCLGEGYTGGKCVGARHRCFCTKEC